MNIRLGARGLRGARTSLAGVLALTGFLAGSLPANAADDGVTQVAADPCNGGSSNPTFYSSNHRMVVTEGGRQLAVYDPHGSGLHLRWRNPGGLWQKSTTGAVSNGQFPMSDAANDRPASIALANVDGQQFAWVVWSGYNFSSSKISGIYMRRLSSLDDSSGPRVGPQTMLAAPGRGQARVDLAFEQTASGPRGVITWLRRSGDTAYQVVTAWLSDVSESPVLVGQTVHYTSSVNQLTGTLVPTLTGIALVVRMDNLRMFTHDSTAPLTTWGGGSAASSVAKKARPSATMLSNGDILAAAERNTNDRITKIVRFNANGTVASSSLETPAGYKDPSIASDGTTAWVAMVRLSDGAIVSRRFNGVAWEADVVEVTSASQNGGDFASPNLVRTTDTHLRMLIDGKRCPSSAQRNAVIAYQRTL
jgi:hypothetical protein